MAIKTRTTERAPSRPTRTDDPKTATALKLFVVLARATAAVSRRVDETITQHGLTVAEFAVLEALYHRGPLLLGEVQRRILVSSGGITFLVDRLAQKGLVERRDCESDRRARYAALTPAGERLIAEIFPEHAEVIAKLMSPLAAEEQRQMTELLKRLGTHAAAGEGLED